MPIRPKKVVRMVVKRVRAQFKQSPLFLRLIPTDKCSLACGYCFQHSESGADMPASMAIDVLNHAKKLGTAVVSFLGGEPLQWKPLEATIAHANKLKMITDITTHGMLLSDARMKSLIESGLDYLNISVDGLKPDGVSKKCALGNPAFVSRLHTAQKAGVKVRINSVLYNDNREKVRAIMDVCQREGFPLSIGFVVPDPHKGEEEFHLSRMSESERRAWVYEMRGRISAGCKIIDPKAGMGERHPQRETANLHEKDG